MLSAAMLAAVVLVQPGLEGAVRVLPELDVALIVEYADEQLLLEKQEALADLGWYEGEVDGLYGPLTEAATEDAAKAAGVAAEREALIPALRDGEVPAAPKPEPKPAPTPTSAPAPAPSARSVWDNLADCESGNWVNGGASFETGSARWDWAKPGVGVPPWGTTIHHGGLQFHPGTWSSFKLDGYPQYAYDASREQQIEVGKRVLASQGWGAWPTCARKLGLR